ALPDARLIAAAVRRSAAATGCLVSTNEPQRHRDTEKTRQEIQTRTHYPNRILRRGLFASSCLVFSVSLCLCGSILGWLSILDVVLLRLGAEHFEHLPVKALFALAGLLHLLLGDEVGTLLVQLQRFLPQFAALLFEIVEVL